ncbi:MAG: ATP-grasp domain-containing protein, partial [Oscillospiraceae bacterium]|nr:ATP-grasp domain-containing protein [Oscillospiraceae bacterium]
MLDKKIGIIGGGQLGKMMILEAKRLGFYVITLDPTPDCPSHSISDEHIVASLKDEEAIFELAKKVDVITYEIEHINADALVKLEEMGHKIYPTAKSLKIIQDKYTQKQTLKQTGVAVPRLMEVQTVEDILNAGKEFGYPMMLKARTGGYDGKGNAKIDSEADATKAYESLGAGQIKLMVEEFVPFVKEISVIACRGIDGKNVIYPVAENSHKNSILDVTVV